MGKWTGGICLANEDAKTINTTGETVDLSLQKFAELYKK